MIKIPTPGTRSIAINLIVLQTRVIKDGTAAPAARESRPRTLVPSCRARKSTNLALERPSRQIIAHLMRSKVEDIVADSETLASSEKVRRIKIEYPRDWLTSAMFLVRTLPLACRQVSTNRLSVRNMRTEPWLLRTTPPIIAETGCSTSSNAVSL
jgi:hypothetical protein